MTSPAPKPDDGRSSVLTTIDGVPQLMRPADDRILAGVAAGVAQHLNVPVVVVRAVFVVLGLLAGAGVVAYALLWVFVPQTSESSWSSPAGTSVRTPSGALAPTPSPASEVGSAAAQRRLAFGIVALGIAAAIGALSLGIGQWMGAVVGPMMIVAVGAAFIWREADDSQRQRWRTTAAGFARPKRGVWWRVSCGIVLVVGGLAVFAVAQVDVASARSAVVAVVLTLVGVAVIAIPWLVKLVRELTDERRGRIREAEKAEVAAHLHDSVLQTLALIQRQPNDAREVQRLARAQERDLRAWLYGPAGYTIRGTDKHAHDHPGTWITGHGQASTGTSSYLDGDHRVLESCAAALARAAAEVEDTYAVDIAPVIVGDAPLTEQTAALIAAAREAMVNAAKHAGVQDISVYAEFESARASVFVRDRGCGFDPEAVAEDRRGVSQSIRGRMERYGGRADVRTKPGSGTEWALTMTAPVGGISRPDAD